jgi:general secretion pathway protein E
MGVESFLLSSTLIGVLAQRLIRLLCPKCKIENNFVDANMRKLHGIHEDTILYSPSGCEVCSFTGYKGRTGIHELLVVDEEIQRMIHTETQEHEIEKHAITNLGMRTLRMDGMRWVIEGKTSLEEVTAVTNED